MTKLFCHLITHLWLKIQIDIIIKKAEMVEVKIEESKKQQDKTTELEDAPISLHDENQNQRINTLLLNNAVFQACKL